MPSYDYRCTTCDTVFEVRRPMSESDAATSCPDGHPNSKRLLSAVASLGGATPGAEPVQQWTGRDSCCGGVCGGH